MAVINSKVTASAVVCLLLVCLWKANGYTMENMCAQWSGEGYIGNPTDCTKWGYCRANKVISQGSCAKGQVFESSSATCQYATTTPCSTSVAQTCSAITNPSYMADPTDCNKYAYCFGNGKSSVQKCPAGQVYASNNNTCVWGPTCPQSSICQFMPNNIYVGDPNNCGSYLQCLNGYGIPGKCNTSPYLYFNPATVRGVLALFALTLLGGASIVSGGSMITDFSNLSVGEMCSLMPSDTSFLRPHTCNYWVRCPANNTSLEEGTCAAGLNYNKDLGRCTMAANVVCPYAEGSNNPIVNVNKCANETDGTFLADSTSSNCKGYILCKGRREVKANCPNELLFNPTSRSCVYSNQYNCPSSGKQTKSPACLSLPNNTRLANDDHCHKFYICINDILYERECAEHTAYDVFLGRCVPALNATCYSTAKLPPPENTFCLSNGTARSGYFADEESCSHYYICAAPVNGKHDKNPQHLECGQGLYFDYEKLSCRDRLNVRCTLDRCAATSLTYVNVLGDCQAYARCSGGATVGSGRCPTDYYFDERSQGCTPVNHNYVACAA
ncbi:hypothetical protein ACLKA7_015384 [Drosophila subpalustris]